MAQSDAAVTCAHCGGPARVQVLEGYAAGRPLRRRLCLGCVDGHFARYIASGAESGRPHLSISSGFLFTGALVALLGVSADQIVPAGSDGFGWRQWSGLLTGALFITLGAMLRVDIVGIAGAALSAIAILADVLGNAGSPGIGWKQSLAIIGGIGFVAIGLKLRQREAGAATRLVADSEAACSA